MGGPVAKGKWSPDMDYDKQKVDDATLALLLLGLHGDKLAHRVWKGFDWRAMERLHEKGWISDPERKARSVALSPEGKARAEELFRRLFGVKGA